MREKKHLKRHIAILLSLVVLTGLIGTSAVPSSYAENAETPAAQSVEEPATVGEEDTAPAETPTGEESAPETPAVEEPVSEEPAAAEPIVEAQTEPVAEGAPSEDEGGIMPMSIGDTIYLDGSVATSGDGSTPGTAVKTFEKAYELASANAPAPCHIYITGPVTVTGDETWDMSATGTGTSNTVTISRRPASDGAAYRGLAVSVSNGATLTMKNVCYDETDNRPTTSTSWAFQMGLSGSAGYITCEDCSFTGVDNGSGTYQRGGLFYGTQNTTTKLTLSHTNVDDCDAVYGGMILTYGEVAIDNCTISNCDAKTSRGGAIYLGSGGTISQLSNTTFTNCTAPTSNGGAIFTEAATSTVPAITNCTFQDCSARDSGGAVYLRAASTLTDCTFDNCRTTAANAQTGGGLTIERDLTLAGTTTLTNCSTYGGGGGINARTNVTVNGPLAASGCSSRGNTGGGIWCGGTFTANTTSLSFTDCKAEAGEGGGLYAAGNTNITADTLQLSGCSASSDGGGISTHGTATIDATITADGCTSGRNGGAINATSTLTVTGPSATFTNCTAVGSGGGVCGRADISMTSAQTIFTGDSAGSGGAAYGNGTNVFKNLTVSDCHATAGNGGGLYCNASNTTVTNSTFTNCTAKRSGGGVLANGVSATVQGVTFTNCSTETGNAGGLHTACSGTMTIGGAGDDKKVTFANCSAGGVGGAFATSNSGSLTVTNVEVTGASATSNGGGCYLNNTGNIAVSSSSFANCQSGNTGGGLFFNTSAGSQAASTIQLDDVQVTDSSASRGGGVSINTGKLVQLTDSTIDKNAAREGDGGGIYVARANGKVSASDGTAITGNTCAANSNGGGVGGTGNYQLHVSGLVNITGNDNGNGAANVEINNTATQLTTYQNIVIDAALDSGAAIGANPKGNVNTLLIAVPGDDYAIQQSDLEHFTHDRLTRGDDSALPIVFDDAHENLILYGSTYKIQYFYDGVMDPKQTQTHTGKPGDDPVTPATPVVYGYSTEIKVTYQDDDHPESENPLKIPSNDSLLIQVKYTPLSYEVKFAVSDPSIGELTGNDDQQQVPYLHKANGPTDDPSGPGQQLKEGVDPETYYFIGWFYETTTQENGVAVTKRGIAMDYTTVPIEGNTTFTAQYAKVPFISVLTPDHGSVSIAPDSTPKAITDGTTFDTYEWPEGEPQESYAGIASFKADPHYHVSQIRVIISSEGDQETVLDLTNEGAQSVSSTNPLSTATVAIEGNGSYGTVSLAGLKKSAQVIVEFEKDPEYRVQFVTNPVQYGAVDPEIFAETTRYAGETVGAVNGVLTDQPSLDGYHLVGWSKTPIYPYDPAVSEPHFDEYDANEVVSGDITYYAIWEKDTDAEYQVQVFLGDGAGHYQESAADSSYHNAGTVGQVITISDPDDVKTITGYTFNKGISIMTGTVTDPAQEGQTELVLKLYYDPIQRNVVYEYNNGATPPDDKDTQPLYYGQKLEHTDPTWPGHSFLGWYAEPGFVNRVDVNGVATMPYVAEEESYHLYARWSDAYCNLTVSKKVEGPYADLTRQFDFTLKDESIAVGDTFEMVKKDKNGTDTTTQITFDASHQAHFTLAHGESVVIKDLPGNAIATITETAVEGYEAHVSTDGLEAQKTYTTQVSLPNGSMAVAYTNVKISPTPSGVGAGVNPWLLVLLAILGLLVYGRYCGQKRRRKMRKRRVRRID